MEGYCSWIFYAISSPPLQTDTFKQACLLPHMHLCLYLLWVWEIHLHMCITLASTSVQSNAHDVGKGREVANTHSITANLSTTFFGKKVSFDTSPTKCEVSQCLVHSSL